jgi:hypothetical protein
MQGPPLGADAAAAVAGAAVATGAGDAVGEPLAVVGGALDAEWEWLLLELQAPVSSKATAINPTCRILMCGGYCQMRRKARPPQLHEGNE